MLDKSSAYLVVIPWARVVCLIYTPEARGPRAAGPRAEGVYIRQTTSAHGITIIYQLMCGQTSVTIIASWPPYIYMGTY